MPGPERVQESVEAAFLGVELDPDDLGVVGGTRAHVFVAGTMHEPLGVPDLGLGNARDSLEGQLNPPEATGPELCELLPRGGNVVVRSLRNRRVGCGLCGPGRAEAELVQEVHGSRMSFGEMSEGPVFGFVERIKERFAE